MNWYHHLFWITGVFYLNLLKLQFEAAKESFLWVKIHLTYKGQLVEKGELNTKEQIEVWATEFVGLFVTLLIAFLVMYVLYAVSK